MSKLEYKFPFEPNQKLFWISKGYVKEVAFKGIRQDKGYHPQIICVYMDNMKGVERPICGVESFGITLFDNRYEAEQKLKSEDWIHEN